jgi:hypothetical protein
LRVIFVLSDVICVPSADQDAFCREATKLWWLIVIIPAWLIVMQKFMAALHEINEHRAQKDKWGNWKPPK